MGRQRKIESPWGSITRHRYRDGRIGFRLRGPVEGIEQSLGIFATVKEAVDQAKAMARATGTLPGGLTVGRWGEQWLERQELDPRVRSSSDQRKDWKRFVVGSRIEHVVLRKLKPAAVRQWVHDLESRKALRGKRKGQPLAAQTVRNALYLLSSSMKAAVAAGKLSDNPCRGVGVRSDAARTDDPWTFLSLAEIDRLLGYLQERQARTKTGAYVDKRWGAHALRAEAYFATSIYAGLRAGELAGLQWADVRLDGAPHLVVRYGNGELGPTKGGKPRTVPLLPPLIDVLRRWQHAGGVRKLSGYVWAVVDKDGHVAPHTRGYDGGWATTWRKRAGIRADVRMHDLRHTCASHLVSGSWGRAWRLEEVQVVLGHASRVTTERYAHLAPEGLTAAADEARLLWRDLDPTKAGEVLQFDPRERGD